MKKIFFIVTSIIIGISLLSFKAYHNDNLKINNKVSTVEWIGKKVTGQHNGNISIKEGSLHVHEDMLKSGKVVIDMESITCTDLEDENWNNKLVGHLNSADFFDVKNHKTATLTIKTVAKQKDNIYTVNGDLTIKGITKPIKFPATIEIKNGKLAAHSEIKIDRTLYDIKYGSGKFFDNLGDKMIDDEFVIKFKIAAE